MLWLKIIIPLWFIIIVIFLYNYRKRELQKMRERIEMSRQKTSGD